MESDDMRKIDFHVLGMPAIFKSICGTVVWLNENKRGVLLRCPFMARQRIGIPLLLYRLLCVGQTLVDFNALPSVRFSKSV